MLRKLDLGNPPNITRKIKTVTTVDWLGSFFRGRNWHRDYPIVHSTEKHRNIRQNIFGLYIVIRGYLRWYFESYENNGLLIFFFHY